MTTTRTDRTTDQGGQDRLQAAASDVAGEAGRTAEQTASRTMERAADALEQFADSMRNSGSDLRDQQPQLADALDGAVKQVDRAASYLREHEPRDILENAQSMAREQPALVVGGGLILGLMLGRLLRSAGSTGGQAEYGYGSGYRGRGYTTEYAAGGTGYGTGYGVRSESALGGSTRTTGTTTGTTRGASTDTGDTGASILASGTVVDRGGTVDTGTGLASERSTEFTSDRG